MTAGLQSLTEKEKQTLRLLVAGHDAKSMARHLGLSVHTVNERLRDARRKLSVSSSKEAARLLRRSEEGAPELVVDTPLGAARVVPPSQPVDPPQAASPARRVAVWAIAGVAAMSTTIAALALLTAAPAPQAPVDATPVASTDAGAVAAARNWLTLVDAGNWTGSFAATAASFRAINTVEGWRSASEHAREPLGRVLSRTLVGELDVPAPPGGYRTLRFLTDFANKRGSIETLSLVREDRDWKVAGIYID